MDLAVLFFAVICIILIGWIAWGFYMSNAENPKYKVRKKLKDGIEIREYDELVIARTALDSKGSEDSAFSIIAGYIFGGNKTRDKIAMTAPVTTSFKGAGLDMFFVMPQKYSMKDLPTPKDPRVVLARLPKRTIAAIRFSGYISDDSVKIHELKLLSVLKESGVKTKGSPFLMQYNGPGTPPFMRRNEVGIEVA